MRTRNFVLTMLLSACALFSVFVSGGASSSAASLSLTFVEAHFDIGLVSATSVAISPDGNHVYVASYYNHAVAVLSVDEETGKLTFVEMQQDDRNGVDGLSGASSVAISPDGDHVYVTGSIDDAVAIFSRNSVTGALTFVEMQQDNAGGVFDLDGATSVALSSGGEHVYVASKYDNAVLIFDRNALTGALSYVGRKKDGYGGVDGLDGACSVAVSSDGHHVYVTGVDDDAVAIFSRDVSTGALSYVGRIGWGSVGGLNGANSVALSPDGSYVYVTGIGADAVVVFSRDGSTGLLTHVETEIDDQDGVDGLSGAWSVAVSSDGNHVYVAGWRDNAVAVFSRNAFTGELSFIEVHKDGEENVDGLDSVKSVAVTPLGEYVYLAGSGDDAVAVFSRDGVTGALTYVQARHSVQGLEGAVGVAVSSDGNHVYVAGNNDDSVVIFEREKATGALSYVGREKDGGHGGTVDGLDGARAVAIDPDGENVYVAGHEKDAVAVFARDGTTGELTYVEMVQDGVGGVDGLDGAQSLTVSADGHHVYVASASDDAVAIFSRDGVSGTLSYVGMVQDGFGDVDGLNGAYAVVVSADGRHVYVASYYDDAVAVFNRNGPTGALTFVEMHQDVDAGIDGLNGANSVALSPDGNYLYVASRLDDAVAVFDRDESSGGLTFLEAHKDTDVGVDGLNGARAIAVDPHGGQVYVASQYDDAVAVFGRDAATGALTFLEVYKDTDVGVDGLDTADGLAVSPDGSHVYVGGYGDNAVVVFCRRFVVYLPVVLRNSL